ncbi:hypothetical protein Bp8pS_128 [Bacillus phage vB_BpuM-BpSp]|nr:hypothetical protein Bp8pS_128 [Bacillus phage vB_BpuM-BpSp]
MENKILVSNLEIPFRHFTKEPIKEKKLSTHIKNFVDKNNNSLLASTPVDRLYFTDDDKEIVFKLTEVDKKDIKDIIKKTPHIKSSWEIVNDPFNIATIMLVREYSIQKNKEMLHLTLLYFTLSRYSSLHYKYYKKFLPNKNIMAHTLNNLNNKFLFKKYGVIIKALEHTMLKNHESYEKMLIRGNDDDIVNYLMYLASRLNNLMKNFYNEYDKSYKNKSYLNTEKDSNDEDNYYEADNVSLMISRTTTDVVNKFYSGSIDNKLLRFSAKFNDASPITLERAIHSIRKNEKNKLNELVQTILQTYLLDGKNSFESISSRKFTIYCISIYSKSNTKDPNIIKIKKLLDYFLKNNSDKYSDTEREATRINYRKAFYFYIVLLIQSSQVKK